MKSYKCLITDHKGKISSIRKEALSKEEAFNSFNGTDYIPLEITEIKTKNNRKSSRKKTKIVLDFTQIMDQLVTSGLSIKDSLEILSTMDNKSGSSALSANLLEMIKKGYSFASSVNEFTDYFSAVYRGIINVGDKIGSVEKIFPKLKSYLEDQKKIKDKISSALLYPILVLITASLSFIAMIFFVFPKLRNMFAEFGGTTAIKLEQNIHNIELGLIIYLITIIAIILFIIIVRTIAKRNDSVRYTFDNFVLKLPIIGKITIYKEILNFSFAMETLVSSGITIEAALQESMAVLTNKAFEKALSDIRTRIIKGESLSTAFAKHNVFPSYITKWMLVGERSGNTEQIFTQIKKYYQSEIDIITTKFMALIEPALIILIGIILITLIITVVIPVFSMYGEIL